MKIDTSGRALLSCALLLSCAFLVRCGGPKEVVGLQDGTTYIRHGEVTTLPLPEPCRGEYSDEKGNHHEYLYQAGRDPSKMPRALIYAHGAGSDERQGMSNKVAFVQLRQWAFANNVLYVSPRDHDLNGLNRELSKKWGVREFVAVGASAGGNAAYFAALHEPTLWKALILLCPAVPPTDNVFKGVRRLTMPIFVAVGEKDVLIRQFCRRLAARIERDSARFAFVEVPKTGHAGLIESIDMNAALDFVLPIHPSVN